RAAWEGAWDGHDRLLPHVLSLLPDTKVRDRLSALADIDPALPLREAGARYGSSGYVVDSVPLALYGAERARSLGFKALMEELISIGGDTDTIASIAGQVAGTLLGREALPEPLLRRVPRL